MNKHSAIYKLYPNVVIIRGDVAYDKDEQEVAYDNNVVEALVASEAYKDLRVTEYPSIGDQLDALWKGGDAAAEMLARVQAVKEKYPKG
jgi:hypothetical protein